MNESLEEAAGVACLVRATNSTLKRGYMLLATRNNSAEAANEARKFYKEPKGFWKKEEMKVSLTSFNHAVGAISKY
jgi:hypothetical protein